ncbi:junctional adhesion molecule A-like [Polyodon spathula]|uniref:junctional adhesion molecule A-like n=1 Tax=Polyodon spathula TaxID=7913 RepID=UPI001B7E777E|nr:junctional adhesion molecule A-like [Polyodon spathula]XP_041098244.1 junctional adhesion molecule A-like [Polyodon spathula]
MARGSSLKTLSSAFLGFLLAATASSYSITTKSEKVSVPENAAADLSCEYSADFGNPRIEWKFASSKGIVFVFYNNEPTAAYKGRIEQYTGGLRFSKVTRNDNGVYTCEVTSPGGYAEKNIELLVQVPPSPPVCRVPTSVTTGSQVTLTCSDKDASPKPTYQWFRNKVLVPNSPKQIPAFQNSSYTFDPSTGTLTFQPVAKIDSGEYYCQVQNGVGQPSTCGAVRMEVGDVNVGGIAAAVIVVLLLIAVIALAVWYANRKGYLPKQRERKPKVVYSVPPVRDTDPGDDVDFRQKSSFLV